MLALVLRQQPIHVFQMVLQLVGVQPVNYQPACCVVLYSRRCKNLLYAGQRPIGYYPQVGIVAQNQLCELAHLLADGVAKYHHTGEAQLTFIPSNQSLRVVEQA